MAQPDRPRDVAGRPRNDRPRDGLGRPLPHGADGVDRVPDDLVLPPPESLAEAQRLLDAGRPFHAHEVLEGTWKAAPGGERELWQGLAQLAVGLTHRGRGNPVGAARLLHRGATRLLPYAGARPHGLDITGLVEAAHTLADDPACSEPLRLLPRPVHALRLRAPRLDDEPAALAAHEELAAGGFAFLLSYRPGMPWSDYLALLEDHRQGRDLPSTWVPSTFLFAEADGELVGRLSLRHRLSAELATWGGHVGYGVRPAHRRRGYATAMLREGIVRARLLGIDRVLVTCDDDNVGSIAVIDACGGRLDPEQPTATTPGSGALKRRYWIA